MNTREILSANLRRLMDHHGDTIKALHAKEGDLSTGTIQRISANDVAPTVGQIDAIAKAYRLAQWQLLVPDLDPARPPIFSTHKPKSEHVAALMDAVNDPALYALMFNLVSWMASTGQAPPGLLPLVAPEAEIQPEKQKPSPATKQKRKSIR